MILTGVGIEVEGDTSFGVDVQFPWEAQPNKTHSHGIVVKTLWVDKYPVTNQLYFRYINSSGWRPADTERWLMHWGSDWVQRGLPAGLEDLPVVYVSLNDARAFCKYAGKRLPHRCVRDDGCCWWWCVVVCACVCVSI